jgi:hypothetical protein
VAREVGVPQPDKEVVSAALWHVVVRDDRIRPLAQRSAESVHAVAGMNNIEALFRRRVSMARMKSRSSSTSSTFNCCFCLAGRVELG